MKKRLIAFMTSLVLLLCACLPAFAATSVSSVACQYKGSTTKGGSVFFYVKANGTTCKLKFTCGKGALDALGEGNTGSYAYSVYGSYEIKITDCTTGKMIYDKDIYCTSSATVSFSATKGRTYKVQVYNWVPATIAKSYVNKNKITGIKGTSLSVGCFGTPRWKTFPSIKATNYSNCTLYLTKP